MPSDVYQHAINAGRVYRVAMGEVKPITFNNNGTKPINSIGTGNLRSCSVVLVASKHGAILAHLAPRSQTQDQRQYTEAKINQFEQHYQASKTKLFPSSKEILVVYGMMQDQDTQEYEVVSQDQKQIVEQRLDALGLGSKRVVTYKFKFQKASESPEFPGKGTVFVDGKDGKLAICVEDQRVL